MVVETLLDSVILIDHFNLISQATDYIEQVEKYAVISVITRAETLIGFDEGPTKMLAINFLDRFPTLEINKPIADLAVNLRRKYRWKLPDALQAALAIHNELKLATRNTKDFSPDKYDFVVVPYVL
jgi:predicted nucleic acid-binding protein